MLDCLLNNASSCKSKPPINTWTKFSDMGRNRFGRVKVIICDNKGKK